jgi:hypothetical protein
VAPQAVGWKEGGLIDGDSRSDGPEISRGKGPEDG